MRRNSDEKARLACDSGGCGGDAAGAWMSAMLARVRGVALVGRSRISRLAALFISDHGRVARCCARRAWHSSAKPGICSADTGRDRGRAHSCGKIRDCFKCNGLCGRGDPYRRIGSERAARQREKIDRVRGLRRAERESRAAGSLGVTRACGKIDNLGLRAGQGSPAQHARGKFKNPYDRTRSSERRVTPRLRRTSCRKKLSFPRAWPPRARNPGRLSVRAAPRRSRIVCAEVF